MSARAPAPLRDLAAALGAAALAVACAQPRPLPKVFAKVGTSLQLAAADLEGRPVDVGAEQGRVRLVDFWATWCEPCRDAFPELDRMQKELASRGLSVYAVSFDEDPAQIPEFLSGIPVGFPILWDRGGDQLSARFDVHRLPTTLIVDRRGVIRFVHEGWTLDRAREQRRQVELLLGER